MSSEKLHLRAESAPDLAVISGVLQDALLPVPDIAYLKASRQFALVANRFCWEADDAESDAPAVPSSMGARAHYRINCGLMFGSVDAVRTRGFDRNDTANILSLLMMQSASRVDATEITLVCAGDAAIRLTVSSIDIRMDDMGERWPTVWRPSHAETEAG